MSFTEIPLSAIHLLNGLDSLNEDVLGAFSKVSNDTAFVEQAKLDNQSLVQCKANDIIHFFDHLSSTWSTGTTAFNQQFGHLGISFLIHFLRKENLSNLLEISLKQNLDFLDDFVKVPALGKYLMAHPKGTLVHWLAGNVPVLGMLSLIQGILTKNVNIVKLPRENGAILPRMVADMMAQHVTLNDGRTLSGQDIFKGIRFVYCAREETEAQATLSKLADVRIAWGGKEAVESVLKNPKKYWTDDVIFGPKYSFVTIDKHSLSSENIDSIAYKVALDASIFEQKGCNSPHTVFIEKGGAVSGLDFCNALAKGFEKVLKRIPKTPLSPFESAKIINLRSEYEFFGDVFASSDTSWSVLFSDDEGPADACYNRTLFVREIASINQVLPYIDHNKQSMGLLINDSQKFAFAKEATSRGIERVTDLGKMSVYDHPWDGRFPMESYVRWVSLY